MDNFFKIYNFLSSSKLQKQYDFCDICQSDKIACNTFYVTRHLQGEICFECDNNHSFYVNTFGKTYDEINSEFSKIKTK